MWEYDFYDMSVILTRRRGGRRPTRGKPESQGSRIQQRKGERREEGERETIFQCKNLTFESQSWSSMKSLLERPFFVFRGAGCKHAWRPLWRGRSWWRSTRCRASSRRRSLARSGRAQESWVGKLVEKQKGGKLTKLRGQEIWWGWLRQPYQRSPRQRPSIWSWWTSRWWWGWRRWGCCWR